MKLKVFAIGNPLMSDDAIGIYMAKGLSKWFKELGIPTIIGDVDYMYCIEKLQDSDFIIIFDATCFGIETGTISIHTLKSLSTTLNFCHTLSFIQALKMYSINIPGIIIGIEGQNFDYGSSLTPKLKEKVDEIIVLLTHIAQQ